MLCKVTTFVDGKIESYILDADGTTAAAEQVCKTMPDAESFCVMVAKRFTPSADEAEHDKKQTGSSIIRAAFGRTVVQSAEILEI